MSAFQLPNTSKQYQLPNKTSQIAKTLKLQPQKPGLHIDYNFSMLPYGNNFIWNKESLYKKAKENPGMAGWLIYSS